MTKDLALETIKELQNYRGWVKFWRVVVDVKDRDYSFRSCAQAVPLKVSSFNHQGVVGKLLQRLNTPKLGTTATPAQPIA